MDIPEYVLKNGPWSISKAGVAERCSLQYDFKYGGHKQKEVVTFDFSRLGIAVHTALELALDNVPVRTALLHAADRSELTTNEIEKLEAFHDQVVRFVELMDRFKKQHGVKPQHVMRERKWGLTREFKRTGFFDKDVFFRGVVDYALLTARNDLIIIDHKSGKDKPLEYYEPQFRAYCLMALAEMPGIRGVQTAINAIFSDRLDWNKFKSREVIQNEYQPWLIKYLSDASIGLIEEPKPNVGKHCGFCGYQPLCPAFNGAGLGNSQINQ